jgi:cytochrome c
VVDRPKASADGFNYSAALSGLGGAWTPENLSGFLENPRGYAPGTSMSYNGMRDVGDRANLIAYLATFQ